MSISRGLTWGNPALPVGVSTAPAGEPANTTLPPAATVASRGRIRQVFLRHNPTAQPLAPNVGRSTDLLQSLTGIIQVSGTEASEPGSCDRRQGNRFFLLGLGRPV